MLATADRLKGYAYVGDMAAFNSSDAAPVTCEREVPISDPAHRTEQTSFFYERQHVDWFPEYDGSGGKRKPNLEQCDTLRA